MAYWCKNCQVPVLGRICHRCGTKLRLSFPDKAVPVFKEEIELLNKLTGEDLNFEDCDLWTAHRCYYYQGEKIFKIEGGNLFERPKLKWLTSERKLKTGYFSKENLILANLPYQERKVLIWFHTYDRSSLKQALGSFYTNKPFTYPILPLPCLNTLFHFLAV